MRPPLPPRRTRRLRQQFCWALLLLGLCPSLLVAGEVVVQNDTVIDFGQVAIQVGFVANERGAAWLTPGCDGDLTAVQVLWLDFANSGGGTLGDSITVSEAGTFPVPGPVITQLVAPLMTEGFFNEFAIDPPIPVANGEVFVVDFKFFESPPASGPSLVTDIDGCQVPKNGIFAIPPAAWFDACALGLSGDIAIRGVVDCQDTLIFTDGFESGDTTAWSSTTSIGGGVLHLYEIPVLRVDPSLPPFWERPSDQR